MPDPILIVGGGFAGLAAGVELARQGRRVRLVEQKPYLGGRARSLVEPATGSVVDNGQHLFMGCYHATRRFLETIGTLDRVRFQPRLEVRFLDAGGRLTSLRCPRLPAPWHLLAGVMLSRSFATSEKMQVLRLGRVLAPSRAPRNGAERLCVEAWLEREGQSENLRRNFWDLICIAAMNEDPKVASAELFQRVLRLALFASPEDSRLGIARVGLGECYTQAASDFITARGGSVGLARSVTGLLISEGVCRGVQSGAERIEADAVICAVPWVQFTTLLPGELLRAEPYFTNILSLRPAPIISINLWFDRPITELEFAGLRGTTIQWLFNKGKILGTGGNYVSLVLSGAHDHVGRSKEDLLATALNDLHSLLRESRAAKLTHSLIVKERFATFSPSWEAELMRPTARTPVRGLYLAGDWTATGLPATIEGAVQSGYTAARHVLESLP
jgi:squalene-associated FAD-dependent desaturase